MELGVQASAFAKKNRNVEKEICNNKHKIMTYNNSDTNKNIIVADHEDAFATAAKL
jgi:hypothetical protein